MPLESVQTRVPEPAVVLEPGRGAAKRLRVEVAVVLPPDHLAADEPGPLEDLDVLRDRVQRHGKRPRDPGDRGGAAPEGRQDRPPRGIGHGREYVVEGRLSTFNHTVEL
jgi:hypothetical protein